MQRLGYYAKRSGPGWLQAAITLGGGSLAGSLFLGVIMGYNMMWLQPFAMLLGVIMLSAVAWVTLTSGERPFHAVNQHISPILGWAWLIAAAMANIVWCLPQFALASGAIQQNLVPSLEGNKGATWVIGIVVFIAAAAVVRSYDSKGNGIKVFEGILKALVGVVVISFMLVVIKLSASGEIAWGQIFKGLIPNLSFLTKPAPVFREAIEAAGVNGDTWAGIIASIQKDKIIAGFGTAVGINMTFLLPYSMLRKSWGKSHREFAIVDLAFGLILPFVIATGCILITSASQFHGKFGDILDGDGKVKPEMVSSYNPVADGFLAKSIGEPFTRLTGELKTAAEPRAAELKQEIQTYRDQMAAPDRRLAAMLVDRKDKHLALTLKNLAGEGFGRFIFGIGVLGMAISTIIILMLINGFCVCEAFNKPGNQKVHFLGSIIPGIFGICFPLFWTGASKAALAVPTSVIGGSLLPIAYFTFLLLMNSRSLLGDQMLTGQKRIIANLFMGFATAIATIGSVWAIKSKAAFGVPFGQIGIALLLFLFVFGFVGFMKNNAKVK